MARSPCKVMARGWEAAGHGGGEREGAPYLHIYTFTHLKRKKNTPRFFYF